MFEWFDEGQMKIISGGGCCLDVVRGQVFWEFDFGKFFVYLDLVMEGVVEEEVVLSLFGYVFFFEKYVIVLNIVGLREVVVENGVD